MGIMTWDQSFSVKIASIDAQHQKLFDLINEFYDKMNEQPDKERMLSLIKGLKEYTLFHFGTEEKYFRQYNYPDYAIHKGEHEKFIATVLDYEARMQAGKLLVSVEVTNFIKSWITSHIKQTDKKYSDFLVGKSVR